MLTTYRVAQLVSLGRKTIVRCYLNRLPARSEGKHGSRRSMWYMSFRQSMRALIFVRSCCEGSLLSFGRHKIAEEPKQYSFLFTSRHHR
jgi:hypothetical protein